MKHKCNKTGVTYSVTKCHKSNIPEHYKCVAEYTTDTDPKEYKSRMLKAVGDAGVSYKYKGSDGSFGFMYTYTEVGESSGIAVSIYNSGSLVGFVAMLRTMFEEYPKHSIVMQPHNNNIKVCYSLAEGYSIRDWHIHKSPLVIMIDKNTAKFKVLYTRLGLTI